MSRSRLAALFAAVAVLAAGAVALPAAADGHSQYNHVVTSPADGLGIHISVYKPAGASAENPVPVILHSHGWGGSRTSTANAFGTERGRGYGVVSIDQRGHGATGGTAYVQDPNREGRDIIAIIDYVASLDWVLKDTDENDDPIADDPVLFAMGGSYGGGYQLVGALTEVRLTGSTRFNALAPEITWFNLPESLAPGGVARSAWVAALYAAGARMHQQDVHVAFAYGSATGQWPDGTVPAVPNLDAIFHENGPVAFVKDGDRLDIPVLIGQGSSDNLFNLNQGWKNFEQTLTDTARDKSIFIGYNGGHALPNVLPLGTPVAAGVGSVTGDACSGGFGALRLSFFDKVLAGENPRDLVPNGLPYHITTAGGQCVRTGSLDDYTTYATGFDVSVTSGALTSTGAGAVQHLELAQGPITVAGIPLLRTRVTTAGADQRVFFALSVGATPATAQVVQNNMMPLRALLPIIQQNRTIELPGVAVQVPAGENLYLTISPISDMSFGHGSARTPGLVGLENLRVDLPVVG